EWVPLASHDALSVEEAVSLYQRSLGQNETFLYQRYPLVRSVSGHAASRFQEPLNVLVIFVEGLDRRYLNRTVQADRPIRVTPFLDELKQNSLYFENFFANGVQTSRGLFATLCSYYPRQGAAAIKARSARDYLCLPSLLREKGYRTEMVVGQEGAINNLRNFFTRNGIEQVYDIEDFPPHAERMGLGMTDAAIFDFIAERVRASQSAGRPLFLATLTLSTHHPFIFPEVLEEVRTLQREGDRYLPALRYFDSEFDRFFTGLKREGLLKNTIVFVLGDHGRHEPQGHTDVEKQVGHFMAPLFVWLDESLRTHDTFRPRAVDTIASQVDVAPTILGLTGMAPNISPFVGHDLSCLFGGECLQNNTAYLSSVYDDLIGLAGKNGIWLYSFRKETLFGTDLAVQSTGRSSRVAVDTSSEYRQLLSLYIASNVLLEQNRIWSWSDLKEALYYGREIPSNSPVPSFQPSQGPKSSSQ
ncbi:MAG: LTA synthase family protein, partial [Nitrospirae bacterium]|nr:LTA synthase family protein [Nitrospirota bacterium]